MILGDIEEGAESRCVDRTPKFNSEQLSRYPLTFSGVCNRYVSMYVRVSVCMYACMHACMYVSIIIVYFLGPETQQVGKSDTSRNVSLQGQPACHTSKTKSKRSQTREMPMAHRPEALKSEALRQCLAYAIKSDEAADALANHEARRLSGVLGC